MQRSVAAWRRRLAQVTWRAGGPVPAFEDLADDDAVRLAFSMLLRRLPDEAGAAHYRQALASGALTRATLVDQLLASTEYRQHVGFTDLIAAMHLSRCVFVQGLPPARRILDVGGLDQSDERGALLTLGYPYRFDQLTVVDLPPAGRHELYRHGVWKQATTALGPVEYAYHSMVDLSAYGDGSFDLVYSGQSIEHVSEAEGPQVVAEVYRVLRPGGWFCLDTPNGAVWRLQGSKLINPDHKIEYTHAQLSSLLHGAGFEVVEAKGLNYAGPAVADGVFDEAAATSHIGVYADIEACLHLAYVCRRPS